MARWKQPLNQPHCHTNLHYLNCTAVMHSGHTALCRTHSFIHFGWNRCPQSRRDVGQPTVKSSQQMQHTSPTSVSSAGLRLIRLL